MSDPVLTLLKYVFLAVLYLFFLRVLRAVWVELREPRAAPLAAAPVGMADQRVPVPRGAPERLVVVSQGGEEGEGFPVSEEMTVGRAAGCGVLLASDTFVSQLHARLFRRDGEIFVEDLGSTNGTFLNSEKVTTAVRVRRGDKVQFGRTTLELRR